MAYLLFSISWSDRLFVIVLCFVGLRYNKPLQASVRAVTGGTLWALKREDFRGILMSKFSNLSSLKLLRSVDILSRLTILQLSHLADSLSEVSFSVGQRIVDRVNSFLKALIVLMCNHCSYISIACFCRMKLSLLCILSRREE